MNRYSVVSARYSNAILELANEKGNVEEVLKDMLHIEHIFDESEELRAFLKSPVIQPGIKKNVLDKTFGSTVTELTMAFMKKLVEARREMLLGEISFAFREFYKQQNNILTVFVTSALPLDNATREEIKNIVMRAPGFSGASKIEMVEKVDKNIIGGIIIRVGDQQIDASFSTKIREFKRAFEENPYVKEF